MWQRVNSSRLLANIRAINLTWDKVDNATSFLASKQYIALKPLSSIVKLPTIIRGSEMCVRQSFKLNKRKTPAVTRVDECTKDDTGVGAAIASGNHLTQGNNALFVIAPINTNQVRRRVR